MTFRNFTPHEIIVIGSDQEVLRRYLSEGSVRVEEKSEHDGINDGIQIVRTTYGNAVGLPPPTEGAMFIVSQPVLLACPDRTDLVAPDTGSESVVRDPKGTIIGVRRFRR